MIRTLALALALAGCNATIPLPKSLEPPPTVLVIRLEPDANFAGHRFPEGAARPYTYRVKAGDQVACATVLPVSVLDGGPGAVGEIEWELANCRGKGGDYP